MSIDAKTVMQLRKMTGAGMMDCKKALVETEGDLEKAKDLLRAKGLKTAAKKAGRATKEGYIGHYLHHNGRMASMVEVLCETDFVATNKEFRALVYDLCKHVAAASPPPRFLTREQVSEADVARERAIFEQQVLDKPEQIRGKIVDGKLEAFFKESCLLDQPYAMDPDAGTVGDVMKASIAKLGENMNIRRFVRMDVSDDVE